MILDLKLSGPSLRSYFGLTPERFACEAGSPDAEAFGYSVHIAESAFLL